MEKINKINLDGVDYEVGGQEYTAGEGIKIENGVISALGGAGGGSPVGVEITYAELKTLRDNSQLVAGTNYIITDYQCTTTKPNTTSAGHQFDIIVVADSENKLNEVARARQHKGDTYFNNSNLAAWELKYSLDNDTTRFEWADATNGKGVIYYMKDEYNNEVPYDFKNIIYQVKAGFIYNQWGTDYKLSRDATLDTVINGVKYYGYRSNEQISGSGAEYLLTTDTKITETSTLYQPNGSENNFGGEIKNISSSEYEYYTFVCSYNLDELAMQEIVEDNSVKTMEDFGVKHIAQNNSIKPLYLNTMQSLNNILCCFRAKGNTFGSNCHNITLLYNSINNTFDGDCNNISINSSKMEIKPSCHHINLTDTDIFNGSIPMTVSVAYNGASIVVWFSEDYKQTGVYTSDGGNTWNNIE